jgi:hypothetical protein
MRNFSGGIDTTSQGAADSGAINNSARQISVTISLATLNAYLSSIGHPQIAARLGLMRSAWECGSDQ